MFLKLIMLFVVVEYVYGADFPSFIQRCPVNTSESELNACVVKNGNLALNTVLHGEPELNIPTFLPFSYEITQKLTKNLDFSFTAKAYVSDVKLSSADVNFQSGKVNLGFKVKHLKSVGNFIISGTLDNKPTVVQGLANISYVERNVQYFGQGRQYENNDTNYILIVQSKTTIKYTGYSYKLYNIKSELSARQNRTLKHDLNTRLEPALDIAITRLANNTITSVLNIILSLIPLNELLT